MTLVSRMRRIGFCLIAVSSMASVPAALATPSIAVDVGSGRVIAHEDAFQRWYPASLTKIMTAYVAFSAVKSGQMSMDTPVTMSIHAAKEPPSKMYFKPGERFPLDSALKYLMVKSANDVAVAIAEAVSGSEEAFVREMNATAKALGMQATRFVNPNGLPGSGQYTTARDMAVLAAAARRNFPEYAQYFGYEGFSVGKQVHTNYNLLIGRFQGADGMKTGFICASGFNQVSSATRNGRTVVSVVLGAPSQTARAERSAALLQAALTSSGSVSPSLASLAPYGEGRDAVADISAQICSSEARAARDKNRDENGNLVLSSPFLVEPAREPRLVQAPAAVAPVATEVALSRIPVPQPRPTGVLSGSAVPVTAFAAPVSKADAIMPLRPGITIPVPVPRPEL
ncbi:D-alanyl-D-alanine carboxypeptidase [Hoeflea phototrophica DFL-43]|uniref:D-alanyl-D-alanine carboxypeptidase n=1 Tax=Hoeflea phototrophica (strain DSM 17068 / NCIMB 14078 / DFL-43) TaxID=411684 RepID=A9D817_HOEPD|nr:D-alanyl-D-alanine carboxypeptidase family protein [Hoeflea phototrophica]EDQ33199.2 D-alanyl-D-alanine carboxypeptidase [Hoeflea phototrophica DFL-43]